MIDHVSPPPSASDRPLRARLRARPGPGDGSAAAPGGGYDKQVGQAPHGWLLVQEDDGPFLAHFCTRNTILDKSRGTKIDASWLQISHLLI